MPKQSGRKSAVWRDSKKHEMGPEKEVIFDKTKEKHQIAIEEVFIAGNE